MTAAGEALRARVEAHVGPLAIDATLDTEGGVLALIGPNGAGKTTLLSLILGALRPRRGRVELGGEALFDDRARVDVPTERRRIGYVPQDFGLFPHLTVRENVAFAIGCRAPRIVARERLAQADARLAELDLRPLAERRPDALSGGERQRVALARALAVEPRALLLDEPLSALDVHARRDVRAFLAGYLRGLRLPTIVVTHDPDDARALAARTAVLEAGRVVQLDAWDALRAAPATPFVAAFTGA